MKKMIRVHTKATFEVKEEGKRIDIDFISDFHGCTKDEVQKEFIDDILGSLDGNLNITFMAINEVAE